MRAVPVVVVRRSRVRLRWFVVRIGCWWLHEVRSIRGLPCWVSKIDLELFKDIADLFLGYFL